jgi:hypothetical protein
MNASARPVLLACAAAFAALAGVGGCGVKGGLETAPPLWGEARARHEAAQAERARAEAEKKRAAEAERQPAAAAPPAPVSPPAP